MEPLYPFLFGVVSTASAAVGVFFFRFWRRTHDRLFVAFAVGFWLMAANWSAQAFVLRDESSYAAIYLLRLAAFAVIIAGVVGKNRETRRRNEHRPAAHAQPGGTKPLAPGASATLPAVATSPLRLPRDSR